MNKQQLMEELNNHITDEYINASSNGDDSKRPPQPEKCSLCESLKDVIESIADDEEAIGELIDAQADKLKCTVTCAKELIDANKSIGNILDLLIIFEGFTILKLKAACTCEKKEKHEMPVAH